MSHANAMSATLEIDGREYSLTNLRIEGEGDQRIYSLAGQVWLAGQSGATATAYVIGNATHRLWGASLGATCRLVISGESFTARVRSLSFDHDPPPSVLEIKLDSMKSIPVKEASPPADSAPEQEIAWHELRSACHRKAWRDAWEIVGTDHTGGATPGEVYIFGVARQSRAVSAALASWRRVEMTSCASGAIGAPAWERIKQVAAWESEAAAQFVKRASKEPRAVDARITVGGREMVMYHQGGAVIVDDPVPPRLVSPDMHVSEPGDTLTALYEMQRAINARAHIAHTMPQVITMTPRALAALQARFEVNGGSISFGSDDTELYGDGRGIAGVLNYPFSQNLRIVPQSSDLASDKIYMSREQYTALGGEALERRTPAKPKPRKKDKRSARHTQRRK